MKKRVTGVTISCAFLFLCIWWGGCHNSKKEEVMAFPEDVSLRVSESDIYEEVNPPEDMTDFERLLWDFEWYLPYERWEGKADYSGGTTDACNVMLMDFNRDGNMDLLLSLQGYHAEAVSLVFLQTDGTLEESGFVYGFPKAGEKISDNQGRMPFYTDRQGNIVYLFEGRYYIGGHDICTDFIVYPDTGESYITTMVSVALDSIPEATDYHYVPDEPIPAVLENVEVLGGVWLEEQGESEKLPGGVIRRVEQKELKARRMSLKSGLQRTGGLPIYYILTFINNMYLEYDDYPGDWDDGKKELWKECVELFSDYLNTGQTDAAGAAERFGKYINRKLAKEIIEESRNIIGTQPPSG